jgi:hypothetical protein
MPLLAPAPLLLLSICIPLTDLPSALKHSIYAVRTDGHPEVATVLALRRSSPASFRQGQHNPPRKFHASTNQVPKALPLPHNFVGWIHL